MQLVVCLPTSAPCWGGKQKMTHLLDERDQTPLLTQCAPSDCTDTIEPLACPWLPRLPKQKHMLIAPSSRHSLVHVHPAHPNPKP